MEDKLLIIHGYSDTSDSFHNIGKFLLDRGLAKPGNLFFADYHSVEDSLSFNDVIDGLHDQLIAKGLIQMNGRSEFRFRILVHSTGGLVVRHWLWRYYFSKPDGLQHCPVSHIVMLAPANFGSPLAHKGRSFLGSLVKGQWNIGDFMEVGRELLFGLELGSPFQWQLAERELLNPVNYFQKDAIKVTVLVGDEDYTGLRGWVNKPGTDGTIVISGAHLNFIKLALRFSEGGTVEKKNQEWVGTHNVSEVAFAVLKGFDHGSIVDEAHLAKPGNPFDLGNLIAEGLRVEAAGFDAFRKKLASHTESVYQETGKPRFQQFIVRTVDDHGEAIDDYSMEFFVFKKQEVFTNGKFDPGQHPGEKLSDDLCKVILAEAHQHTRNPSFRRFLVDHQELESLFSRIQTELNEPFVFSMRLHGTPIEKGIRFQPLENILIYDSEFGALHPEVPNLFYPNTTTLIELEMDRTNTHVKVKQP